jgi:hypothetical protein
VSRSPIPTRKGRQGEAHVSILSSSVCGIGNFLNFRPYGSPYFDVAAVGGDILVLAGEVLLLGCNFVSFNLFHMSRSAGSVVAVLGGSLDYIGGGYNAANVAQLQAGVGVVIFVGASGPGCEGGSGL